MPKIAQYQPDQVSTQVVQQPRASATGGNAVFKANQQITEGLTDIATQGAEMNQRIDTTSAEEALVNFERDKNNLFFDPETGYYNTQGKNAFDNAGTVNSALDELKNKYGESLGVNAKRMFDKSADLHIMKDRTDIMRHASKGMKAWEVATINSQVENTIENASLYWDQPDKLRLQSALGRQSILDAAEMEGVGPEVTNERLQTFESSFAKSTVSSAIANSYSDGQKAMDDYGSRLEGPDLVKLEKELTTKKKAEKLQSDSQQAILTGTNLVDTYDSREEIRDKVNEIEDPELRKKSMTEAMRQFNLKKKAASEDRAASFERAESHIIDGGSAETYQAEDPEGWEKLSTKQKKSIESGKSVITDWAAFSDLMTLPRADLAKVDPTEYFSDLAPSERSKLISAVKSANGTGTKADKVDSQVGRTRNAQVTAAMEQVLGKKSKWNDDKRAKASSFYDLLDSEVRYREGLKDGPLSSQEFTDTLSDLTREVTIERSAFGVDFLAPDVEQDVTDIPPENLRVLSNYLRDNNIPVTVDNLMKAQRQAEN